MIVKANMGGNWLWGLMILKSLLKQMSSVAIGRNGSNLSYGKVTWFFYLSVFQVSYNDYEPYILGLKELLMLWQLSFSWKYTLSDEDCCFWFIWWSTSSGISAECIWRALESSHISFKRCWSSCQLGYWWWGESWHLIAYADAYE